MSSTFETSVTAWIQDLKQGDQDAARLVWERYFPRLLNVASRRMGRAARRVADEEDVAVSVFDSLCAGAAAGRFDKLGDRDDLWKLLVAITGMKAVDQIRRQTSKKRGGEGVRGQSLFEGDEGGAMPFADSAPTPEFLLLMDERQNDLFALLRDDVQRRIAADRLEGYSNEEIAKRQDISLRSVERKLKLIRETWETEL